MDNPQIARELDEYRRTLHEIEHGFTRSRDGYHIKAGDDHRLSTAVQEIRDLLKDWVPGSEEHRRKIAHAYGVGLQTFSGAPSLHSVREIGSILDAVLKRVKRGVNLQEQQTATSGANIESLDFVSEVIKSFHNVALQLSCRYNRRHSLLITDEYDVQDLLHALLRIRYKDVRTEEYIPSYAGRCSRTDFFLPEQQTLIEIKKTRLGLGAKEVGEQLIIDIERYRKHPQCKRLVCFVYDPELLVHNPAGIENDLCGERDGITVLVKVAPQR